MINSCKYNFSTINYQYSQFKPDPISNLAREVQLFNAITAISQSFVYKLQVWVSPFGKQMFPLKEMSLMVLILLCLTNLRGPLNSVSKSAQASSMFESISILITLSRHF
ncbi:hypothetical protein FGO68_gene2682 [Halteria grandinella]|uniref:Uncharacterized protein n=1 Tax=Halteria grandinella TaxID=5974 RepID=A0A8J8SX34_HALGN|nr:hypothetical protein FGO68_gene2682 [Halteria grandinella]